MKKIAIDFDGVIRIDTDELITPLDRIYPGSIEFIRKMKEQGNIVIIFTARNIFDVVDFITSKSDYTFVFDVFGKVPFMFQKKMEEKLLLESNIGVTNIKPEADIYIDDRGYRFEGDWKKASEDIESILE